MPKEEKFNLVDQIRRAATSIPANIAEGSSKHTLKERRRFINIAYCSAQELENHFIISHECGMINTITFKEIEKVMNDVLRLLNCYYKNPMAKKRN
jgi:four helix bundle protein